MAAAVKSEPLSVLMALIECPVPRTYTVLNSLSATRNASAVSSRRGTLYLNRLYSSVNNVL